MAGLVPAIHVFAAKTWMPGLKPGMTGFYKGVDAIQPDS